MTENAQAWRLLDDRKSPAFASRSPYNRVVPCCRLTRVVFQHLTSFYHFVCKHLHRMDSLDQLLQRLGPLAVWMQSAAASAADFLRLITFEKRPNGDLPRDRVLTSIGILGKQHLHENVAISPFTQCVCGRMLGGLGRIRPHRQSC